MVVPPFLTAKYGVLCALMVTLCVLAFQKTDEIPSSDVELSCCGLDLTIGQGKFALTTSAGETKQKLFHIISYAPARFNLTVLDEEWIHRGRTAWVWFSIFLMFLSMILFRLRRHFFRKFIQPRTF